MHATTSDGQQQIRAAFARAREAGRCAVLPFITAGYPDAATTERLLRELPATGADIIEIGFPFSDPIADGPVIAESMHLALVAGITPDAIFDIVARAKPSVPVIAMVSVSIVERMGRDAFIARAVASGFSGFIVPDADPTALEALSAEAARHGAGFCALVSPTTPEERLAGLARQSTGFIYLLARVGVTGERTDAPEITERVARLRAITRAPIAAGFGIATAAHIKAVGAAGADGAIVGSAIVRKMTEAKNNSESAADAALSLVRSYRLPARAVQ